MNITLRAKMATILGSHLKKEESNSYMGRNKRRHTKHNDYYSMKGNQILDETVCVSLHVNAISKDMNPFLP